MKQNLTSFLRGKANNNYNLMQEAALNLADDFQNVFGAEYGNAVAIALQNEY